MMVCGVVVGVHSMHSAERIGRWLDRHLPPQVRPSPVVSMPHKLSLPPEAADVRYIRRINFSSAKTARQFELWCEFNDVIVFYREEHDF